MSHPNEMRYGPHTRNMSVEAIKNDPFDQPGKIVIGNFLPYVGRLVRVETNPIGEELTETTEVYEPASIEEMRQRQEELRSNRPRSYENDAGRSIAEAAQIASELWQESWISGVPQDAIIFCQAHQENRPAHGSNLYDNIRLCNNCVTEVERMMAGEFEKLRGETEQPENWDWCKSEWGGFDLARWTEARAKDAQVDQAINNIEQSGEGFFKMADGRWAEIHCLYSLNRSEYRENPKEHWPNGVAPDIYRTYIRSDWQPGQYFNSPDREVFFTSRNRLKEFMYSGGELPKKAKRAGR